MRHTTRVIGAVLGLMTWATCACAQVVQSTERNPLAPALQQVEARFARVQREVDRLRAAGQAADADAMAQRLQHFRDQLAGTAPSRVAGPELNVIGTYDQARAIVDVRSSDRPIVLALTSYERVNWDLRLAQGANLQKVIVSGYEGVSRPLNLPQNIPVELYSHAAGTPYFYAYRKDFGSFPNTARQLHRLTGLPVSSFQSRYAYGNTPFVVGAGSNEWAAQRVLTDMLPLYNEATALERAQQRAAAEPYRFVAVAQSFDAMGRPRGGRIAEWSPLGPVRNLTGSVTARHVAVDPRGPTYYADNGRNTVTRLDPGSGTETPVMGIEWLTGLTFDTRRNRLVASNLSGEGFLFTHSPGQNGWTTLSSLNNVDMFSTTYSAADDALYALTGHRSDGNLQILKYDAAGRQTRTINLSEPIASTNLWDYQLTATGDRLSLITTAVPDLYEPHLPPMPRSYLIDPATGAVTYLGVIPEPGAAAMLACLLGGGLLRRRDPAPLRAT